MELTSNQREFNPVWFPFEEGAQELVEKFMDRGETPPVFFVPAKIHSRTIKFIEKKIIEAIAKYDSKIFYIDNLDWIVDPRSGEHERMIQFACMELKRMAVLWNVTIVLIAHVKKLMNPTDQPSYNDIKGSSAVYQISDTVIMMWRETKRESGELIITNNVNVSVQLNRKTGKTGNVKFKWQDGHYVEYDWARQDEELDALANNELL
jgi:replicative DNA helicase